VASKATERRRTIDAAVPKPSKVTFIATELCNMRCRHCYSWKTRDRRTLSTEVILDAMDELAGWVGEYKLFVAGGEPTIRKDLGEIIRVASGGGCLVSMATNGFLLDEERTEELVMAGLGHVDVALDSLNPEVHDAFRGRKGTQERALRAIEFLDYYRKKHDRELFINAAAVVSAWNYAELCAMAHWAQARGFGNLLLQPIVPPFWSTHDRGWLMRSDLWPRDIEGVHRSLDGLIRIKRAHGAVDNAVEQLEGMKDYFSWAPPASDVAVVDEAFAGEGAEPLPFAEPSAAELKLEPMAPQRVGDGGFDEAKWGDGYVVGDHKYSEMGPKQILSALDLEEAPGGVKPERLDRCQIGWKVLNINHVGDVRLCHDMPPIGNLNRQSLYEIWTSPRAMQMRELIAHCHEGCYLLNCNFCD
jgi:MoaA/NifB/PqqE/SkfB family radical SAM enzyme